MREAALASRHDLIVSGERRVKHLDRDGLLHQHVRRAIDRAHAAFADAFLDAVLSGQRLPDQSVARLD
jgi:hypothetical protein